MLKRIKQYLLNRAFDEQLSDSLKKDGVDFKKKDKQIIVYFPEKLILRKSPSSDFPVFLQVFHEKQYEPVVSFCRWNNIQVNTIVDLGANVGLTSIYLKKQFGKAVIYAIEPDLLNFETLQNNINEFTDIKAEQLAIWSHETFLSPAYEEQSDWGKTFHENSNNHSHSIKAMSIRQFISHKQLNIIDILKIDIEGAEKHIFEGELDFLGQVKVIAIEIHETFIAKKTIQDILLNKGFILQEAGELLIGINMLFLSQLHNEKV